MSRKILSVGGRSISSRTWPEGTSPALGVDVGGTSVKVGIVDVARGSVLRAARVPTPQPARIDDVVGAVAEAIAAVAADWAGDPLDTLPLGIGLSGDVRDGRHTSGVNLHPSWVGAPARDLLEARLGRGVTILNDADAAGLAEARYGAAAGILGVVVVLTFGTGIGSAILHDGRLAPNSGLGQFPFHGEDVEQLLSAVARERRGIGWREWAGELSEFLGLVDRMLRPDLLIVGGGVSEAWPEYEALLRSPCPVRRATLGSAAGVVGAAAAAAFPDGFPLPTASSQGG